MEEEALELITGKLGVMDRTLAGGEGEAEKREVQNKIIMPEYRVKTVLVS